VQPAPDAVPSGGSAPESSWPPQASARATLREQARAREGKGMVGSDRFERAAAHRAVVSWSNVVSGVNLYFP
jgi:hypothetical protein